MSKDTTIKTKEQFINVNIELRRKIAEFEKSKNDNSKRWVSSK